MPCCEITSADVDPTRNMAAKSADCVAANCIAANCVAADCIAADSKAAECNVAKGTDCKC